MKCPECNAKLLLTNKFWFCEKCGQSIPKETPEQLKTLTILYSDLSGFSQISDELDPEQMDSILKETLNPLTEVIRQNGGKVIKYLDATIIAAFGMDHTREDDPARAALAALTLQSVLLSLNTELEAKTGVSLKMRIGLNTGFSKVSQIGGKTDVIGDTVNLASQLESMAPESSILISEQTYKHIRGFSDVKSMGAILAKGKSEPVQVYQLLAQKERGNMMGNRGIAGLETKMIGREKEMHTLTTAFQRTVDQRQPMLVTVIGEAGLGKSRLEFEFGKYLKTLPSAVTYGKGDSFPVNPMSLYPFYRIICERADILDDEPKASAHRKLEAMLAEVMPENNSSEIDNTTNTLLPGPTEEQCHFIAELIGLEYDESPYLRKLRGVDPQLLQMRGFYAFCQFFRHVALKNPLVLVFEDIHWADQSTLLLIEKLSTTLHDVPLLLLCLARPDVYEKHPEFNKTSGRRLRIDLKPLTVTHRHDLIAHLLRNCANIPAKFNKQIDQRSQGNPFFTEELVRMFIDQGVIQRPTDGAWTIHPDMLKDFVPPSTIEGVIQARFDSLNKAQQELIRQAAVVGRIFWRELLVYIAEKNTTPTTKKALSETLNELNRTELVYKRFTPTLYGYDEYIFKHILTREVIYRNTLRSVKQRYHQLAGEWLEQQPDTVISRFCDTIAHHFEQGQVWNKACRYYQQAGANAHKDNDLETGIQHYTRALEMLEQLRKTATEDQDPAELEIRLALNKLFDTAGQRDRQAENLHTALSLSEQGYDQTKQVDTLNLLSWMHHRTSQNEKSLEHAKNGLSLARTLGYRKGEALSLYHIGGTYLNTRDYAQALSCYEQALLIQREIGDRAGEGDSLNAIGNTLEMTSEHAQALTYYEQALSIRQEVGNRRGEAATLNNIGVIYYGAHEYAQTLVYFEQTLSIYQEIGDRFGEAFILNSIGSTYNETGCYEQAITCNEQALPINREIGNRNGEADSLKRLGNSYLDIGNYTQATAFFERALPIYRELKYSPYEVHTLIQIGKAALLQEEQDKAIRMLSKARALADKMNHKPLQVEIYTWLSIAYLKSSPVRALPYSEQAMELLEEMTETEWESTQQIWWNHYQVLSAIGGAAKPALQHAYRQVMEAVSKMTDNSMRQRYLEDVRVNRDILAEMNKRY